MLSKEIVSNVIGKTFADKLDESVIESGKIAYTRRQMVEDLGCANFMAAARLQKVLRKLKIYTATQLANTDPFSLARVKGIGESCMFGECASSIQTDMMLSIGGAGMIMS